MFKVTSGFIAKKEIIQLEVQKCKHGQFKLIILNSISETCFNVWNYIVLK